VKRPETHTPVLFFRIQYAQGGVQTTYVRVANHLAEEGRPPHVFSLLRRGPLLAHFHPQVPVQTGLLGVFRPRFFRTLRAVDAVFIPDCYCLCIVAIFSPVLRLLNVKVLLAVYHPREYHFHGVLRRCYRTLVDSLPRSQVLFMNSVTRETVSADLGLSFADSPIVPVPALASVPPATRGGRAGRKHRKIVSIGRLVDFKLYPYAVIDTLQELKKSGHGDFSYHIYGDGPLRDSLAEYIARSTVSDRVFLHGEMPYAQFGEVVADAFAFVGMGMSMVEAACRGVPSLIAIESVREPVSYGFFGRTAATYEFCIGECKPDEPTVTFAALLTRLDEISEEEYAAIVLAGQEESKKFSLSYFSERLDAFSGKTEAIAAPGKFWLAGLLAPLLLAFYCCVPRLRTQFKTRYARI
jgi:1,2-diacylglycerol 3-alpha-glucosyltransferase